MGPLYRDAVEVLAHTQRPPGQASTVLHQRLQSLCQMVRRWFTPAGVHGQRGPSLRREETRPPRAAWRRDQHRGQKRGDGIGYSGYKHQKGEKIIAITDNHGYVLSPLPVAPVNKADMVLFPEGLKTLKRVAKMTGLVLTGAYLNLDGGFESKPNRTLILNA